MSFTPPPSEIVPEPPPAPSRDDEETVFDEKANEFVAWYAPFAAYLVLFIQWANTFTNEIADAIASIVSNTAQAETAASLAMGLANYKGEWSAQPAGALNIPAAVSNNGQIWVLKQNIANVAAEVPGVSNKWISYNPIMPVVYTDLPSGTTNYNVVPGIHYGVRNAAGNTGKQVLVAPAAPGDGAMLIFQVLNNLETNEFNPNGKTAEKLAENMVLDEVRTYFFRYTDNDWKLI